MARKPPTEPPVGRRAPTGLRLHDATLVRLVGSAARLELHIEDMEPDAAGRTEAVVVLSDIGRAALGAEVISWPCDRTVDLEILSAEVEPTGAAALALTLLVEKHDYAARTKETLLLCFVCRDIPGAAAGAST